MTNPNKKLNIVSLSVNGQILKVNSVSTIELGGFTRETEDGDSGPRFKETPKAFSLEVAIVFDNNVNIDDYRDLSDATITLECDTGQSYTVSNGWVVNADVINQSDGTFTLSLAGPRAVEVR